MCWSRTKQKKEPSFSCYLQGHIRQVTCMLVKHTDVLIPVTTSLSVGYPHRLKKLDENSDYGIFSCYRNTEEHVTSRWEHHVSYSVSPMTDCSVTLIWVLAILRIGSSSGLCHPGMGTCLRVIDMAELRMLRILAYNVTIKHLLVKIKCVISLL